MASRFLSVGFRRASSRVVTQPSIRRWFASYPSHDLVGMPSLSPVRRRRCILMRTLIFCGRKSNESADGKEPTTLLLYSVIMSCFGTV
jgi:hypothetical protein